MLAYDDERIIGPNDWSMAGLSHDVLKLGYEGHGHKAHAVLAYNQNAENINGGTYYANGAQPYKTMQVGWYHYDVPKIPLGASLLFMNIGMQAGEEGGIGDNEAKTEWQLVYGGYLKYAPSNWQIEASYYRQAGHDEYKAKLDAWMATAKVEWKPADNWSLEAGYDY